LPRRKQLRRRHTALCNWIPSGYLLHSHGKWPIEIDGLPINFMVIFNGYATNNQRVSQLLLLWISHVERWFAVDPSRIKMIVPEAVSSSRTGRSGPIVVTPITMVYGTFMYL